MSFLFLLLSACGANYEQTEQSNITNKQEVAQTSANTTNVENISTGYINTNGQKYVELYSDTSEDSVISRMYDAEPITIYTIQNDWANVSYGGMTGYMKLKNISFSEPIETTEKPVTEQKIQEDSSIADKSKKETEKTTVVNNQINQSFEQINIIFLCDDDGFKVAQPVSYPSYLADNTLAWCSAQSIYIYSQPDINSSKREANMLYYGDVLSILGSVDDWYYIETDSGNGYPLHGYVKKSYITIGQTPVEPEPANATKGRVVVNSANVRSSPNKETSDNILFTVYQGAEFNVLDYDGYWYKINYNNTICYISHKMVEVW